MGHWAKPELDPDQTLIFSPTLRESLAEDHPVRLVGEVLGMYDWSAWEREYVLVEGQPPIHPRHLAGAIVYGMSAGIRSSRALEEACRSRLDFMLLTRGQTPDHTTFAKFRTRFQSPIRELFRFLGRLAAELGLARLNGLALDGTRVGANSSRHATATAKTIEERLAELDRRVAEMLAEAEAADREEDTLFGSEATPHRLSKKLSTLQQRQEALARALAKAREQEARRAKAGAEPAKTEGEPPEVKRQVAGPGLRRRARPPQPSIATRRLPPLIRPPVLAAPLAFTASCRVGSWPLQAIPGQPLRFAPRTVSPGHKWVTLAVGERHPRAGRGALPGLAAPACGGRRGTASAA